MNIWKCNNIIVEKDHKYLFTQTPSPLPTDTHVRKELDTQKNKQESLGQKVRRYRMKCLIQMTAAILAKMEPFSETIL